MQPTCCQLAATSAAPTPHSRGSGTPVGYLSRECLQWRFTLKLLLSLSLPSWRGPEPWAHGSHSVGGLAPFSSATGWQATELPSARARTETPPAPSDWQTPPQGAFHCPRLVLVPTRLPSTNAALSKPQPIGTPKGPRQPLCPVESGHGGMPGHRVAFWSRIPCCGHALSWGLPIPDRASLCQAVGLCACQGTGMCTRRSLLHTRVQALTSVSGTHRIPAPSCDSGAYWGLGTQSSYPTCTGVPSGGPQPIAIALHARANRCLLAPSRCTHSQPLGVIQALAGVWLSLTTYQHGRQGALKPARPSAAPSLPPQLFPSSPRAQRWHQGSAGTSPATACSV